MRVKTWRNIGVFFLVLLQGVFFISTLSALSSQAQEYLRKARVAFKSGSLKNARDYFLRAKKIEPDNSDLDKFGRELEVSIEAHLKELRQRADFYFNAKNIPEAQKLIRQLLVLAPKDPYGKSRQAEIRQINKQIEEFKNDGINVSVTTGRYHDLDLYSAISLLNRARGFLANGDRESALKLVLQVLDREPGYKLALELKSEIIFINKIEAFVQNAESAFQEGKMRECVDSLDKLIKDSPARVEFLLLRAKAHLRLENYSEAERDLWNYYGHNPQEKDELFALFSELYYGLEQYELALGFAVDQTRGISFKSASYQYKCFIKLYPFDFWLMCFFVVLIPFAIYYTQKKFDLLVSRFPPGGFRLGMQLLWGLIFSTPDKYLPQLIEVARGLNTAWLNYLAGICLFKAGQYDGAQRFLAFSFTNDFLAGRAYYFYGLTRHMLDQDLSNHDFEESILASLGKTGKGWHPKFVKTIEREILAKYGKEKGSESYEGLAYKLVGDQIGEA